MLSFKENFFFFRFSALFFILTIFGYWGLDLNSEELYIAFSFFVLVIASFILVRNGVLFFFVKAINAKYSRILVYLLITLASVRLQVRSLVSLDGYLSAFVKLVNHFVTFIVEFVSKELPIFSAIYSNRFLILQTMLSGNLTLFSRNCLRSRRFSVFFGKLFDIVL